MAPSAGRRHGALRSGCRGALVCAHGVKPKIDPQAPDPKTPYRLMTSGPLPHRSLSTARLLFSPALFVSVKTSGNSRSSTALNGSRQQDMNHAKLFRRSRWSTRTRICQGCRCHTHEVSVQFSGYDAK